MTPEQLAKAFGVAMKQRRVGMGLYQRQLAERLGVTRECISRIENGKRRSEFLFKVAAELGCNLSTLIREAEGQ